MGTALRNLKSYKVGIQYNQAKGNIIKWNCSATLFNKKGKKIYLTLTQWLVISRMNSDVLWHSMDVFYSHPFWENCNIDILTHQTKHITLK